MNHAQRASLQRRTQRWELWVSLWLTRLLAMMPSKRMTRDGAWPRFFESRLTHLANTIMCIVLCRASLRVKTIKRRGFRDPRQRNDCTMRALYGAALRKAFKAKTPQERLAKIRRASEQLEILTARFTQRLRNGMTKIMSAYTRVAIIAHAGAAPLNECRALLAMAAIARCADSDTS